MQRPIQVFRDNFDQAPSPPGQEASKEAQAPAHTCLCPWKDSCDCLSEPCLSTSIAMKTVSSSAAAAKHRQAIHRNSFRASRLHSFARVLFLSNQSKMAKKNLCIPHCECGPSKLRKTTQPIVPAGLGRSAPTPEAASVQSRPGWTVCLTLESIQHPLQYCRKNGFGTTASRLDSRLLWRCKPSFAQRNSRIGKMSIQHNNFK